MEIQSVLVGLIVAGAAAFSGRRLFRTMASARRKDDGGCAGGCGCGDKH